MGSRLRRTVVLVTTTAAAAALVAVAAPPAAAYRYCTNSWNGGSGNWSDPTRWSEQVVPRPDDYVCIVRTPGTPLPVVTVDGDVTVPYVAVRGATVRIPSQQSLTSGELDLHRSTLTGGGLARNTNGELTLFDSTLDGIRVIVNGSMYIGGVVTFTRGADLDQPATTIGLTSFARPTVLIRDGDGDPRNHLALGGLTVSVPGDLTVDVPLAVRGVEMWVSGTARLKSFDSLDDTGRLLTPEHAYLILDTRDEGRIVLPRTITQIGDNILVGGDGLVTPDGGDALADLTRVQGALELTRDLTVPGPLIIAGRMHTTATLTAGRIDLRGGGLDARTLSTPGAAVVADQVRVDAQSRFDTSSLSGTLYTSGTNQLAGAHLGRLVSTDAPSNSLATAYPTVVTGSASLRGIATVNLPDPLPADGTSATVLTASSVTGRFTRVNTVPRAAGTVTLEYQPDRVVAVFHAAVA